MNGFDIDVGSFGLCLGRKAFGFGLYLMSFL